MKVALNPDVWMVWFMPKRLAPPLSAAYPYPFHTMPGLPFNPTVCGGLGPGRFGIGAITWVSEAAQFYHPPQIIRRMSITLCPDVLRGEQVVLDLRPQPQGTSVYRMRPAWLTWYHELFHVIAPSA